MSVLKSKRKPSQFEVFHHLNKMRKEVTDLLLRDFGYDLDKAVKKVESLEMDGHQVTEVHYYYKGICKNCLRKDKETRID